MTAPFQPAELMNRAAFDVGGRPRLVFGPGCAARVGELARELGGRRALLVTDAGLVRAGHAARVADHLRSAGLTVATFDRVHENPTTEDVGACLAAAREARVDLLVGLGGGSAMDTAKGANFLLTNGGEMRDYWGVGKAGREMLPFIAVPTTTGTGSEMQCAALIADAVTHQKMACLDAKALARVALLDPELTRTQPPRVAACAGIDALSHAIESAVTTKRTAASLAYSRAAYDLITEALPRLLTAPADRDRGRMQLGAAFAGAAIERSMLGAAHAAANPLTARFQVPHGFAVGLMLPGVIRFNAGDGGVRALYREALGREPEALAGEVAALCARAGGPRSLRACGATPGDLPVLAALAEKQWTAEFNPRRITEAGFAALYAAVLE